MTHPKYTVIAGQRRGLLRLLSNTPHLLACHFCHRKPKFLLADEDDGLEITGVVYECHSYFVCPLKEWKRNCHELSFITIPLRNIWGRISMAIRILLGMKI